MPRTALFLSPHLDDVAFSCGGTAASLVSAGWNVVVATVFTRSTPHPSGFALDCQLDKGLSASQDYMRLRRTEDIAFARTIGATFIWLNMLEAPSRGYTCAADLFAGIHANDRIGKALAAALLGLVRFTLPTLVFAPQGLGNHIDHLQVIRAVRTIAFPDAHVLWYRDAPYAIHQTTAHPTAQLPAGLSEIGKGIDDVLPIKIAGCRCYKTQIPFQFNGDALMATELSDFAREEGWRLGARRASEAFLTDRLSNRSKVIAGFRDG